MTKVDTLLQKYDKLEQKIAAIADSRTDISRAILGACPWKRGDVILDNWGERRVILSIDHWHKNVYRPGWAGPVIYTCTTAPLTRDGKASTRRVRGIHDLGYAHEVIKHIELDKT